MRTRTAQKEVFRGPDDVQSFACIAQPAELRQEIDRRSMPKFYETCLFTVLEDESATFRVYLVSIRPFVFHDAAIHSRKSTASNAEP